MMSLLTVVQDVCEVVGVAQPSTVFGAINTDRTMQEMVRCANEMAQRISGDTREWAEMQAIGTFSGPGDAFTVPSDFRRMLLTSRDLEAGPNSVSDAVHLGFERVAAAPRPQLYGQPRRVDQLRRPDQVRSAAQCRRDRDLRLSDKELRSARRWRCRRLRSRLTAIGSCSMSACSS